MTSLSYYLSVNSVYSLHSDESVYSVESVLSDDEGNFRRPAYLKYPKQNYRDEIAVFPAGKEKPRCQD